MNAAEHPGSKRGTALMRTKQKQTGFTLAEVLIVVAIIAILAGVSAVSVSRYQRSMHQLEMDGYAKEVFVAAQNHLSIAKGMGYLTVSEDTSGWYGTKLDDDTVKALYGVNEKDASKPKYEDIYYFVVGKGLPADITAYDSGTLLDEMLPFGAVEETVRMSGSYVILYQRGTGTVLDVFYASASGTGFGRNFRKTDVPELMEDYVGEDKKAARAKYGGNAIIGWYGSGIPSALPKLKSEDLNPPKLEVVNGEKLSARVWPENGDTGLTGEYNPYGFAHSDDFTLSLEIYGFSSEKTLSLILNAGTDRSPRVTWDQTNECYEIILDDITDSGKNFALLGGGLIPGEDIRVTASLMPKGETTPLVSAEVYRTNSLFAYNKDDDDSVSQTAKIACFRHLENLDPKVSNFQTEYVKSETTVYTYKKDDPNKQVQARQTADLTWDAVNFPAIYGWNDTDSPLTSNGFYPVTPGHALAYDGGKHTVTGVTVNTGVTVTKADSSQVTGAGLFGVLENSSIQDLKLVDFTVNAAAHAGALAGSLEKSSVTNVLACYDKEKGTAGITAAGTAFDAGGLAGRTVGCDVEKCAAALTVTASGNAGGLIGSIDDTGLAKASHIRSCYSGGQTENGAYQHVQGSTKTPIYNVSGASAGGLVGTVNGVSGGSDTATTWIEYSYSTCSAKAASASGAAGGLVGSMKGGKIGNAYAVGLVGGESGAAQGAFAGSLTGTVCVPDTNGKATCRYYKIVNERKSDDGKKIIYLEGTPSEGYTAAIVPLDGNKEGYQEFIGKPTEQRNAKPYDSELVKHYRDQSRIVYSLGGKGKGAAQLGSEVTSDDFVAVHYGDWPCPELWVINVKQS